MGRRTAVVPALIAGLFVVGTPLVAQAEDPTIGAADTVAMECRPVSGFVTAQDGDFRLNERRFKHVAANTGGLVYATAEQRRVTLDRLCGAGVRQIRVDILNDRFTTEQIGNRLDTLLREAAERGIYVTVILQSFHGQVYTAEGLNGAKAVPGDLRTRWCDAPPAEEQGFPGGFYTRSFMADNVRVWMPDDCWINGGYTLHYKPFVDAIVTRFKDRPEIFAWDIANEQNSELRGDFVNVLVNFYTAMAAAIKDKDPNHMVTTGLIGTGTEWSGMEDAQRDRLYTSTHTSGRQLIDYVVIHDYNASNDNHQYDDIWRANYRGKNDPSVPRWNKPVSIEESGIAAARSDFTVMQRYYRDMFYGCSPQQTCSPSDSGPIYGSVDSITQFGVEFSCKAIGSPDWNMGDNDFGPCQQNRLADYEALWKDWRKRLDSYNKFPGGIVVDNYNFNNDRRVARSSASGSWSPSKYVPQYWASGYQTATIDTGNEDGFTFLFNVPNDGRRTVDAWWTEGPSRSSGTAFVFRNTQGQHLGTVYADQRYNGGQWKDLGQWDFTAGWNSVTVSRWSVPVGEHVIADAVRIR